MKKVLEQKIIFLIIATTLLVSCYKKNNFTESPSSMLFTELNSQKTNIKFENQVSQEGENHILNYSYLFNGGGIAILDINNDGLQDIYFTGNSVPNKMFLNKGGLQFEDITHKTGLACNEGWKTGVTVVDINKDGYLDLYICRSAMSDSILRKNLLFINNKDLSFKENADRYGLGLMHYSTQAAFFDYDHDGDEDMFLINHSLPEYTKFTNLKQNLLTPGDLFASKLFLNEKGKFKDISNLAGIANNVLSFGLGLAISDINKDGWLDMYVSNDFNDQDYMYINNQNGTFTNKIKTATGHISLFSMGSDIADINNDQLPDIMTVDMMPHSNERIKLSTGDDNYDKNQVLENNGLQPQTMRNMLHLNRGDGTFSEIGQFAGISNTDWSWSSLFSDFDGDQLKDLYVSNGYEKDFTNMQFLKFTVDERIRSQQSGQPMDLAVVLANIPSIEEGNFIFKNDGTKFINKTVPWGLSRKLKSNGAAYADLDNDGDPEIIINTMNQPSFIYQNNAIENLQNHFIKVDLIKSNPGVSIIGTKVYVYTSDTCQYFEFSPTRGFQSSMYTPICIGIRHNLKVDSILIQWPDQRRQTIYDSKAGNTLYPEHRLSHLVAQNVNIKAPLFNKVELFNFKHSIPTINDFKQQLLLPKMYSSEGPKIIKGYVDQDDLSDIFITTATPGGGKLFKQKSDGTFIETNSAVFNNESGSISNATFFDADNDGDIDLFTVLGNYSILNKDAQDKLYINDGKGNFTLSSKSIPEEQLNGSVATPIDIDQDGDLDLFIGNRMVAGQYPIAQNSLILINDGKGYFTNNIQLIAPSLENAGIINDAVAADINNDGATDLVVVGEWTPVIVMINDKGQLKDKTKEWIKSAKTGWWTTLKKGDYNHDGKMDFIIGNAGTNNQYKVTEKYPISLFYKDFDKNGQIDPFLCYFIDDILYPYASRDEALGQVGFLRDRFLDYNSYARAHWKDIFTLDEMKDIQTLSANTFESLYLQNTGTSFISIPLPVEIQYAPIYTIENMDIDSDGDLDFIAAGNECNVRVRLGRSDANPGYIFINDGNGQFKIMPPSLSRLNLTDDTRTVLHISNKRGDFLLVGQTNKPVLSFKLNQR